MQKITIITINYNNCEGLRKTLKSVARQSCHDFEYVVIDGGSTDGSVEAISDFSNSIDFWVSERDQGIYHAMNKGIDHAHGEYCLFLNSGDILHDDEVIANVVTQLSADIAIGAIRKATSGYVKRLNLVEPLVLLDFWFENPIPHQSTFIRREICEAVRYDESLKIVGDLKFFLEAIVKKGSKCQSIDTIVADFDEDGVSTKVNSDDEWERVFKELLTPCVFDDFQRMLGRRYDYFYAQLRLRKYHRIVYSLSVAFVRLLSVLRPTAKFARRIPLS